MMKHLRKIVIGCLALILAGGIVGLSLVMDLYYRFPFYWSIPLSAIAANLALVSVYFYGKTFRRGNSGIMSSLADRFGGFSSIFGKPAFSSADVTTSSSVVGGIYRPLPFEVAEAWSKVHSVVWLTPEK